MVRFYDHKSLALFCSQGNKKSAAFGGLRLDPDFAVLAFENALSDGQAEAFALSVGGIEAMEDFEDFTLVFGGDADAVIFNGVGDMVVLDPAGDVDEEATLWIGIFECVVEQVRKDVINLDGVSKASRQVFDANRGAALFDLKLHGLLNAFEEGVDIEFFDAQGSATEAGEAKETGEQGVHFGDAGHDELNGFWDVLGEERFEFVLVCG
jgi:hypothetical protein